MICIREFEIHKSNDFFIAEPLDTEGDTFGESFEGAIRSASNWLRETALDSMAHGRLVQGGKLHDTLSRTTGSQPTLPSVATSPAPDQPRARLHFGCASDACSTRSLETFVSHVRPTRSLYIPCTNPSNSSRV